MDILFFQAFLLILPVVLAGMTFIVVLKIGWLRILAVPIDGGRMLGGRPILGKNKTWLGIAMMSFGTAFFAAVIAACWEGTQPRSYSMPFATLVGAAYSLGELPNSFLKRRFLIGEGSKGSGPIGTFFSALDIVDSVVASVLVISILNDATPSLFFAMLLTGCLIHVLTDAYMRLSGLKK